MITRKNQQLIDIAELSRLRLRDATCDVVLKKLHDLDQTTTLELEHDAVIIAEWKRRADHYERVLREIDADPDVPLWIKHQVREALKATK